MNKCLRRILDIHWPDRISNKELWKKTDQEPVLVQLRRRKWNWLGHALRKNGDSTASKHCSGQHKAIEEEGDRRTHGGGSSRMKCGWRVSGTAGGRWRRQRRTEMDGDEVSVAYAPPGVTRQEKKTKCCASIMFYRKVNYKLLI